MINKYRENVISLSEHLIMSINHFKEYFNKDI